MTDQEPTYEYVRGEGWIINPPKMNGQLYDIVDLRQNKDLPGRWYFQVWLVEVPGYSYVDWVNESPKAYQTLESCKLDNNKLGISYYTGLFASGMKQRIVNMDQ